MTYKCPFCNKTFENMGGGSEIRKNDAMWEESLFYHLFWFHEKELTSK